jgi:hypothetical protein
MQLSSGKKIFKQKKYITFQLLASDKQLKIKGKKII